MNIEDALFDFNQINVFIPWLILVNVLYWAFIWVLHLTWTDVFNDFLIQSQNHCLHKICSCHICSCMLLVWTLIYGFALMNLLSNLLNSFWVHTYELQNVSSRFLPFWRLYFMLNILMFFSILMFFNTLNLMKVVSLFPSKTTWNI